MFEVIIDGKKVKAEVSFQTAIIYESEFGSDMLQDVMGAHKAGEDSIVEFKTVEGSDGESQVEVTGFDFTRVNWGSLLKALWASIKTADPSVSGYTAWANNTRGIDMLELNGIISDEIADCFFRSSTSEPTDQEQ